MPDIVTAAKKAILTHLLQDFRVRGLGADALRDGYDGLSLARLRESCLASNAELDAVDFDLALQELENSESVTTGPMEVYENDPNDSVVMIGMYSKREWVALTQKGYKAAR